MTLLYFVPALPVPCCRAVLLQKRLGCNPPCTSPLARPFRFDHLCRWKFKAGGYGKGGPSGSRIWCRLAPAAFWCHGGNVCLVLLLPCCCGMCDGRGEGRRIKPNRMLEGKGTETGLASRKVGLLWKVVESSFFFFFFCWGGGLLSFFLGCGFVGCGLDHELPASCRSFSTLQGGHWFLAPIFGLVTERSWSAGLRGGIAGTVTLIFYFCPSFFNLLPLRIPTPIQVYPSPSLMVQQTVSPRLPTTNLLY